MKLPKLQTRKSKIVAATLVAIIVGGCIGVFLFFITKSSNDTTNASVDSTVQQNVTEDQVTTQPTDRTAEKQDTPAPAATPPKPSQATSQWPVQLSSADAVSLTVVVNKKHKLPSSYAPALGASGRLRTEADTAFASMLAAAKASGAPSMIYLSGYRSYARQEQLYNNYVARDGKAAADTYSARPGFSEHQTGLAVDVGEGGGCDLETCFENTASAKWVATKAHSYGFVIRYPKGKDGITGYQYEPWHLRYLGVAEATAVYKSGKTVEEYYGIPGGGYN